MNADPSRRNFLAAGLALPVVTGAAPPESAGGLNYRTLGRTGLKVTSLGFGCMITTDPSVIARSIDMGVNYFDTARSYQSGNNEHMVGAALGKRRKDVVLSTKTEVQAKGALEDLETSLKALRTDHVDIWYLHSKDSPDEITDDLIEAQETAKKQGKVRFTGVSTHRVAGVAPKIIQSGKFDVLLSTYNFTVDARVEAALESLHRANIGTVAMKVMAGGTRGRRPNPRMQRPGAALAALKWVLRNPNVTTTVPSMTDTEQLEENFKAMSGKFSEPDEKVLAAWLEDIRPLYCRMCGQCDGKCPKGLPVSEVLRYLMYAEGYGQYALGRERYLALPPEVARVRCSSCASCAVQCPNGVRVAERLVRAQELLA